MSESVAGSLGHDELQALKTVALDGGLASPVKVSCAGLAERLEASTQTASRRLQELDSGGFIEREIVSDGQWVSVTERGEGALRAEYADYRRLFEESAGLTLTGAITSGMGEGKHYISLSGYQEQFESRLGYTPFPGTLNLDLAEESVRARPELSAQASVPIDAWEDGDRTFGAATCYPAIVEADSGEFQPAHVIVPDRTHHDEDSLELIAPTKLRDELDLADGDTLTIHVEDPSHVEEAASE